MRWAKSTHCQANKLRAWYRNSSMSPRTSQLPSALRTSSGAKQTYVQISQEDTLMGRSLLSVTQPVEWELTLGHVFAALLDCELTVGRGLCKGAPCRQELQSFSAVK